MSNKTTTVTLQINTKVVKQFEKALKESGEDFTFQEWLELELNQNYEALQEMLLGDY